MRKLVKRAHFEVLQKNQLCNMPRVVLAGEFKNGLGFEIQTSYDNVPTTSQCATEGQSSCAIFLFADVAHPGQCVLTSFD